MALECSMVPRRVLIVSLQVTRSNMKYRSSITPLQQRWHLLVIFSLILIVCTLILLGRLHCEQCMYQLVSETTSADSPTNVTKVIIVTPTYVRPTQMADMTRLCNTLKNVPDVFWVVVEDSTRPSKIVRELLEFYDIPFVHLAMRTNQSLNYHGRGIENRNEGLRWIRENIHNIVSDGRSGVLYFADDDNAYDLRLFDILRKTQTDRVSMFPVGAISTTGISTPVIDKNGTFLGYFDPSGGRKYMVDMAGFAVGLQIFLRSKALFKRGSGQLENKFLGELHFHDKDIQFLANNCTRIYVWHVKTSGGPFINTGKLSSTFKKHFNNSNIHELVRVYAGKDR